MLTVAEVAGADDAGDDDPPPDAAHTTIAPAANALRHALCM
jgi:hypothetical protein